jgi:trehalose 6-phosphate synthase/phosphatase
VIVSNRLPFNVQVKDDALQFKESAGGLVSGLEAYLGSFPSRKSSLDSYIWAGWPGNTVESSMQKRLVDESLDRFHSHPVFLSEGEMETFYHGFCNKTIWPLFHYFPSYTDYREELWQSYKAVNERFCDAVLEILRDDDIVWVHDYHLMLLPRMLRTRGPAVPIGFFLHIPFPSFEIFRLLPGKWRREMLEGLLGADLVGFHTFEYTQNFLRCVLRVLDHDHNLGQIFLPTHIVKADTFPMGIDYEKFRSAVSLPETITEREELSKSLSGMKVILSVDRLDYSKGILNRLEGYELLLDANPQFRGKVVFVMIVVPSRVAVDRYESMKKQIEEQVGRVNGRFGTVGWTPVVYQYRSVPFHSLVAQYGLSDVALVTPLRDGMNLVAKEYIATRTDGTGVLVLSEMAGAVKELGESIVVNPNYREEIADALREALEMPVEEQRRRNATMQQRLSRYTVERWADEYVRELLEVKTGQDRFLAKLLSTSARKDLLEHYEGSKRRLILLDYDGTLVPLFRRPHLAAPTDEVLRLLKSLSAIKTATTLLISGRDKETMEEWFGDVVPNMVAEHGIWIREQGAGWKLLKQQTTDWKAKVLPIVQSFSDRLPASFVEEKDFSVALHFRGADPEQSRLVVAELADSLTAFTAAIGLQVLRGNKVIEVRMAGVNKGSAALHWLSTGDYDFVLAIGDDVTDEDIFQVLPEDAFSIRVGIASTYARFNVHDSKEVIKLLESLLSSSK